MYVFWIHVQLLFYPLILWLILSLPYIQQKCDKSNEEKLMPFLVEQQLFGNHALFPVKRKTPADFNSSLGEILSLTGDPIGITDKWKTQRIK